jgi:hypothetical protein
MMTSASAGPLRDSAGFVARAYAEKTGLRLRAHAGGQHQPGDPQAEQRHGQPGLPWLFHETGEGEHGEGQAYPVG